MSLRGVLFSNRAAVSSASALTQKPRAHSLDDSCRRSIVPSPRPRGRGHSRRPASSSPAPAARRRPRAMCCSRPAMARPACRISAPSARSCAPPWCARPSSACRTSRRGCSASPTTWTGCARCPTTCPNQEMLRGHLGKPLTAHARSVRQRIESFGASQQRAAARASSTASASSTSSSQLDRLVQSRAASTRRCCSVLRALRRGHGGHAADPGRGAAADLFARSCRSRPRPAACCRCRSGQDDADGRHDRLSRRGRHPGRGAGHRRPLQAAMEARLGDALVRARRRLRDVGQGPHPVGRAQRNRICRILGGRPPEGFNYELFLDEKGKKISKSKGNGPQRRGVAAPMRRRRAWRCSCSRSRGAPSGSISTSSRAPSTIISRSSRSSRPRTPAKRWRTPPGTSMTARPPGRRGCRWVLRHAAQSRERRAYRGQGRAVGLHQPLRAGRHAGNGAAISTGWSAMRWPTTATS